MLQQARGYAALAVPEAGVRREGRRQMDGERADATQRGIEDRRARLWGNVRRADDNPRSLEAELERLLADQKGVQQRLQAEQSVLSACKAWLDRLPTGTKLEPVAVTVDGHELAEIRKRIKAAIAELDALKRAPAPSIDIEQRVRDYLRGLAPKVRGVGVGERSDRVAGCPVAIRVHLRAHL